MKKKLTEKQQKELAFMKDWILIVHEYIHKDSKEPYKSMYEEAKICKVENNISFIILYYIFSDKSIIL